MEANKQYLGDGIYVENDGFAITLTTENGVRTSNTIYLESVVFSALIEYGKTMRD
jgi:hypothetical protein